MTVFFNAFERFYERGRSDSGVGRRVVLISYTPTDKSFLTRMGNTKWWKKGIPLTKACFNMGFFLPLPFVALHFVWCQETFILRCIPLLYWNKLCLSSKLQSSFFCHGRPEQNGQQRLLHTCEAHITPGSFVHLLSREGGTPECVKSENERHIFEYG